MSNSTSGSLIGGSFGLLFVVLNSGSLPTTVAVVLRLLAGGALALVVVAAFRPRRSADSSTGGGFGPGFWAVVAGEAIVLLAGMVVIRTVLHAPQAGVAWVSFVVGLHFFALALLWRLPFFHLLAASMAGCGSVALALALTQQRPAAVDTVGGVLPGLLLLTYALWASRRAGGTRPAALRGSGSR